jgi:hypothetical protein
MEPLAPAVEEAGDAGRVVGRLDQLDLRLPHPEERDADVVALDVGDRLELEAEDVAPEREAGLDRADDDGDVVDPPESPHGRDAIGRRTNGHGAAPLRP